MHTTPRFDLYAGIHKAMRLAMSDTLSLLGGLDCLDADACRIATTQLGSLLELCRSHVHKEETYVHPMIEARCKGRSLHIAADHVDHIAALDSLEAMNVQLRCAPSAALASALYRQLAVFVGENFEHMEIEESTHNEALWAAYSDEELMQVHGRILASVEPTEMVQVMHWMLPAVNHEERSQMLLGMRDQAPAPAFQHMLQLAQARLAKAEWNKLLRALQVQAEPSITSETAISR